MERLKSKRNEKLILLHSAFKERGNLCINDVMSILSCNRQSAYNYLTSLEDSGYILKKKTEHKKTFYSLEITDTQNTDSINYLPITGKTLYKYEIIQCLNNGPSDINAFQQIDISQSYLYKLLKEMLDDEDILKKENTYYLNTKKHSVTLSLSHKDISKIGVALSNLPTGHPYYHQLSSVKDKVNLALGNIESDNGNSDNYIVYGRKQFEFETISSQLKRLEKYHYKEQILNIRHLTKSGREICTVFATGIIVYALEKDAVYLMGKSFYEDNTYNTIIKWDNIVAIEDTCMENTFFHADEFQDIYRTMFSISMEEPVKVVVEFDNIFNIKKKLMQLCTQRTSAEKLQFVNDKIIYTDTVRGLSDFANYLRRFGRSFRVIEPPELKDMLQYTVTRSLERYLQEETGDDTIS